MAGSGMEAMSVPKRPRRCAPGEKKEDPRQSPRGLLMSGEENLKGPRSRAAWEVKGKPSVTLQ